ncbi:MAG: protein kinase [Candidatus Pacebacteria bacterium]|nr:protein kinase [Candidatus Paceibacterota bacterium]
MEKKKRNTAAVPGGELMAVDNICAQYWSDRPEHAHVSADETGIRQLDSIGKSLSDYAIIAETGRGGSGTVYKAQSKVDGRVYALKRINMKHIKKANREHCLQEVRMLKSMKHPQILECFGSFIEGEDLYIVTEFADHGDLDKLIKHQISKNRMIGEGEVWEILWQIALGLLHLHANSVIHRDIKTLNILLTSGKRVKIGDLGESVLYTKDKLSRVAGTPLYLPPEVIKGEGYDPRVDVWGLGCVGYQLTALAPPFAGENLQTLFDNVTGKPPKEIPWYYCAIHSSRVAHTRSRCPDS